MRQLWELNRSKLGRNGTLSGKIGVICPKCGEKLKVNQIGVFLALILPCMGAGAVVAIFDGFLTGAGISPKFIGGLLMIPAVVFWYTYGPCFARVRAVGAQEEVKYPLSPSSWNDDEFLER